MHLYEVSAASLAWDLVPLHPTAKHSPQESLSTNCLGRSANSPTSLVFQFVHSLYHRFYYSSCPFSCTAAVADHPGPVAPANSSP